MMAAAASSVRYAPEDPTLPKPWKGLIDGNTGYLYFWNPETNITQYERPVALLAPGLPPPPTNPQKPVMVPLNPAMQAKNSAAPSVHGPQRDLKEEDVRFNGTRGYQVPYLLASRDSMITISLWVIDQQFSLILFSAAWPQSQCIPSELCERVCQHWTWGI